MSEYEIKLSISDFRNDFKKGYQHKGKEVFKHDMLKSGELGIKQFFFCAPVGIIPVAEIPSEYGFYEFTRIPEDNRLKMKLVKRAKNMSNQAASDKFRVKMMEKVFWEYKLKVCQQAKGEWL